MEGGGETLLWDICKDTRLSQSQVLRIRKETSWKPRAGDPQQLRALLGRKLQHCPLGTDCPPPSSSDHEKKVLEDPRTLKMNIIMQMGLSFAADSFLGIIPYSSFLRHLKK